METYLAILIALFFLSKSDIKYRAILLVITFNFIAHKLAYIFGIQLTSFLEYQAIYVYYALIQLITILILINLKSHFAILGIILIQIGYNMLTVSQYVIITYDFYSLYPLLMNSMMILELIYMGLLTKYARNLRRICNADASNIIFRLCGRYNNRGLF